VPRNHDEPDLQEHPETRRTWDRRQFIRTAAAGTALVALGGAIYRIAADDLTRKARAETRADGRKRLPPGQKVIEKLRDMGGDPGSGAAKTWKLKVHGRVKDPYQLDYAALLKLPQTELEADVHCVTGWSVLGARFKGVRVADLADQAGVDGDVRHVVFEAAHGYTANVPLDEATAPNVMLTYRMNGKPLAVAHGAPVRGLVPDLYFWKSAKWITGIRFVKDDEPGYWEVRGYHNHADPWKQERYA
jgi:DMSO/TMAO reductase YedYZ molybdopterin-dependent catalytic subunit